MNLAHRLQRAASSFVIVCALCGGAFHAAQAQVVTPVAAAAAVQRDPVLRAMTLELQRSKDQLRLENMQRPYYIEYSIVDRTGYDAEVSFGAVQQEALRHFRILTAIVRIGDYKHDSSEGQGESSVDLAPIENDVDAIRHQLWLMTDSAYKSAIRSLTAKEALLKQFEDGDTRADDFSREEPAQYIGGTGRLEVNTDAARDAVVSATALYGAHPDLQSLDGRVSLLAQTHYFVNSEGTVLRQPETTFYLTLRGIAQAADGMRLERRASWVAVTPAEIPAGQEIQKGAQKIIGQLEALRTAPVVDDEYRGPVLVSADASADIFSSLVAANIAARKPPLGQTSRTVGEYASSYKGRVLPEFLSVVDNPTVTTFGGRTLAGAYLYDDQGVKARPVEVVDKGRLVNYLLSREPIRDFPSSNGHGRGSGIGSARAAIGNMFVKSLQPQSYAAMKQKLIDMCRDGGQPYGYIVDAVGPGLTPELLRRVWVKDGREELVRGAEFHQLDARALRSDLIAAGDDPKVANMAGSIGQSVIAPSLLFEELQIRRSSRAKDKLPDYPPPGTKLALQNAAPGKDKAKNKEGQ